MRSSKESAETVNIVEPSPPIPRRISSWVKFCEKPAARLETETMINPVERTDLSLKRFTIAPAAGGGLALLRAMRGEIKYYERNIANGAFATVASRAKKYPGIFVRPPVV